MKYLKSILILILMCVCTCAYAQEYDEPGTYMVNARYAGIIEKPDIVLAIGQFRLFGVIFGAIAIFFASLICTITGCIIVLVTYLKSRKLKKEARVG